MTVSYTHLDVYKRQGEKTPEDNDYDVYEAHVDIIPIISRVEIKSLGSVFNKQDEGTAGTPTEHLYTSVTVKGIGMVDYYNMGTLGKDYNTQMVTNTTSNPDGLIYDPEPVSYTHLDVYKRQGEKDHCLLISKGE